MSRIRKAYETRFRWLLQQVGARQLERGVEWLVGKAQRISEVEKIPLADGLTRACDELAKRSAFFRPFRRPAPQRFFCDGGLGGLARWLRAAGYEALWVEGIDDDQLLQQARAYSAAILTTDGMLMERRVLRDRVIPSFWLPPTLSLRDQLACVFQEFRLQLRPPLCMSCGGRLVQSNKEALRERIPPRTYRWLDEYFVCSSCGKLFWHGTHWHRIVETLKQIRVAP